MLPEVADPEKLAVMELVFSPEPIVKPVPV
jgi:hypothetical protein